MITLSPAAYHTLRRDLPEPVNPVGALGFASLLGVPIQSSPAFPTQHGCKRCEGTGEGDTSTFCRNCRGAGQIRTIGMVTDDRGLTLITEPLPKRFAPYFPAGLVRPRNPVRIVL